MKIATRYIPYGALPYKDLTLATRMVAHVYGKCPYIACLPNISENDTIIRHTLENMPGIIFDGNNVVLKAGTAKYEKDLSNLDKAFNNPTPENLELFASDMIFLEKFLHITKKFKSPNACINLTGPFTISQILRKADLEQILADKSYRKLFIQAVTVKALWIINKIKEFSPTTVPVVMLEESLLGQIGVIRRENEEITIGLITNMLAKVIEKLKEAGAIVGVQCFEKCDWTVPINAGVDIISFDAYNNPNNLHVIKEAVTEYITNGGIINWAEVPCLSEEKVKNLSTEYISKRLFTTIEGLFLEGVPLDKLYKSATISMNSDTKDLPAMFSEKLHLAVTHIADKLAVKF